MATRAPLRRRCQQISTFAFCMAVVVFAQCVCEGIRIGPTMMKVLVPPAQIILSYHGGQLLTGPSGLNFYSLWVGNFTTTQKAVLSDFVASFTSASSPGVPSVESWWSMTTLYKGASNAAVASNISLASQVSVPPPPYSSQLTKSVLLSLLLSSLSSHSLPVDPRGIYFIFTAENIPVEDFCMNSCGFHDFTAASPATRNLRLPYAWVGNSATQCPGFCAWPFANPQFGSQISPLVSPNHDVGMDGIVINTATLLAGMATNPYDTGYYEGDPTAPLEAVSACAGIYGTGAFPGNPGALLKDQKTGASFNSHGVNGRLFLLPAMWSPKTSSCTPLS